MLQILKLIQQLSALGIDFSKVIPLITQVIAAAKAKDWATVVSLIAELLGLINPNPQPTPPPNPVFGSAADAETAVISEAVAAGCPQSDIEALVNELK